MAKKKTQTAKLAASQQSWTDQSKQTASAAEAAQAEPVTKKRTRTSFNVHPDHMQILYDLQAQLARTGKRPNMSDLIEEAILDLGKKHGVSE